MKKLVLFAISAVVLASCSDSQIYTIEGSFNIPETFQLGDTVINRGPIEGSVYLIGLDNNPIDSAEIIDEKFMFTGAVSKNNPFFAYIVSDYGIGMLAIEQGAISVEMGKTVLAQGTPINDGIAGIQEFADQISMQLYDEVDAMRANGNETLPDSVMMDLYLRCNQVLSDYVDSVYQANQNNLIGVYAANVQTASIQSSEELESVLSEYSEYVRNSELMATRIQYYKSIYGEGGADDEYGYPEELEGVLDELDKE